MWPQLSLSARMNSALPVDLGDFLCKLSKRSHRKQSAQKYMFLKPGVYPGIV